MKTEAEAKSNANYKEIIIIMWLIKSEISGNQISRRKNKTKNRSLAAECKSGQNKKENSIIQEPTFRFGSIFFKRGKGNFHLN